MRSLAQNRTGAFSGCAQRSTRKAACTAKRITCSFSRQRLAVVSSSAAKALEFELDRRGVERVKYEPEGWNYWTWKGHRVHWVSAGPEKVVDSVEAPLPPVLLVHGYGASAYHWRYQLAALAKTRRVYAVCLLGFGWSEKALVDYTNGNQWIGQLGDFIEQVVGEPAVLVGNSLGGYASLATAAFKPNLVRAVAMLNGAGPMRDPADPVLDPDAPLPPIEQLKITLLGIVKRVVLFFAFTRAKQPERIKEVLQFVYIDKEQIDDELVNSIVTPATDPQACEVFFRLNHSLRPPLTVNQLLDRMQAPLLLLWGMQDPWITPARAEAIRRLYPSAEFYPLSNAGHCPHDDTPLATNDALAEWINKVTPVKVPAELEALSALASRLRV